MTVIRSTKEYTLHDLSRADDDILRWVRMFYSALAQYGNGDFVGEKVEDFRHYLEHRAMNVQNEQGSVLGEVIVLNLAQVSTTQVGVCKAVQLPVGMVTYSVVPGIVRNCGFLSDLYVLPNERQRGTARYMIAYCHIQLRRKGATRVQALFPPNSKANQCKSTATLLRSCGYESTPFGGLICQL